MEDKLLKGLTSLFENERALRKLKNLAVSYQEYELAADLRAIEKEKYPTGIFLPAANHMAQCSNIWNALPGA